MSQNTPPRLQTFILVFGGILFSILYFVFFVDTSLAKIFLSSFSAILLVIAYIFSAIRLKEWSPTKFPEQILDKEKKHLYEKFEFDEDELKTTIQELSEAKKNLKKL